jgi:hypothetical protein
LAVPIIIIIFSNRIDGRMLGVFNGSSVNGYEKVVIKHIEGATEGDDGNYDARYLESPNPLQIYSRNYCSGIDYSMDARPANSTTTYDLHLLNTGGWGQPLPEIADNFLRFEMVYDTNFTWKNIFLGDANDSNNIVADIKHIIYNGGINQYGRHYGDFPLPDVVLANRGVYDKRKIFFFNHADLNRDRKVNGLDYAIWANNFGRNEESDPNTLGSDVGSDVNDSNAYADIDRSGAVDYNDLSLFSGEWLWDANDPNTWSRAR